MVRDGKSKKVEEEEATGFKFFKVAAVAVAVASCKVAGFWLVYPRKL